MADARSGRSTSRPDNSRPGTGPHHRLHPNHCWTPVHSSPISSCDTGQRERDGVARPRPMLCWGRLEPGPGYQYSVQSHLRAGIETPTSRPSQLFDGRGASWRRSAHAGMCAASGRDGVLIVEFELACGASLARPAPDLETHVRLPLSRIEPAPDIEELSNNAASEIRRLSGFDRVMIHRIRCRPGEVIAEAAGSLTLMVILAFLRFPWPAIFQPSSR